MDKTPANEGATLRLLELSFDTTQWLLEQTSGFPKRYRQSLTARIELAAIETLELLTSASYRKGRQKLPLLQSASDRINQLRVLMRLAYSLRLISHERFEECARRLVESGALMGGWLRQQQREPPHVC